VQTSGGESPDVSQGVHAQGTTIVVEDLFYNTPARRRFLKSDAAEYGAIAETFSTLALSRPDITFILQKNDLAVADYPVCANHRERMAQVLGEEFNENVVDFELSASDLKVHGCIGSPDYTRVNRTGQKLFINGRPVVSPAINNALSRAYDEFLPPRRFPVAVLFLDIPSESIDVNVHPAKREVRIRNERAFIQQLTGAVRAALRKRGFHVQPDAASPGPLSSNFLAAETRAAFGHERVEDKIWSVPSTPRSGASTPDFFADGPAARMSAAQALLETEEQELPFDMIRILGQLHACYLVVESKDGFFLVDQHAAHERVVYEDLLSGMQHEKAASQQLLFPAELQLGEQESVVLQQDRELLEGMGFGLNDQGGGSFSILAVPGCLMDSDAAALLTDCVHELVERSQTSSFDSRQQELAAVLACKTHAVKAGHALDTTEQLHLVRRLGACDNPHACPHGRPTFIRISGAEIEKRFLRT
jgi:DNA mismatch repair protein MutL